MMEQFYLTLHWILTGATTQSESGPESKGY